MSEEGERRPHLRRAVPQASMEPRSNERGRAAASAELTGNVVASMEPRSNERGRPPSAPTCPAISRASMEPRSNERGRSISVRYPSCLALLQWSLAPMSEEGSVGT